MVARLQHRRVDMHFSALRRFARARADDDLALALAAARPEPRRAGDEGLDFSRGPRHRDLLLPVGAFREHAEIEHGALARSEIDGDEGVVDDVGRAARVALVLMIDVRRARGVDARRLVPREQPHEIEEVAAFLDQRAAGARGETVPVPDLVQERETVLADGDHLRRADGALRDLAPQFDDGRHVAVFHRHPDRRLIVPERRAQSRDIRLRSADRLLHENGQRAPRRENVPKHSGVRVVRADDDERVDIAGRDQLAVMRVGLRAARGLGAQRALRGVRIGDRGHRRALDQREVADVLAAHHARADQSVADPLAHCPKLIGLSFMSVRQRGFSTPRRRRAAAGGARRSRARHDARGPRPSSRRRPRPRRGRSARRRTCR